MRKHKTSKTIFHAILFCIGILFFFTANAAKPIPLVYEVENTGFKYPKPKLPTFDDLPEIKQLTDPFMRSDNKKRSVKFKDWSRRRAEIAHEIQHYEIGEKPGKPDSISATYKDGQLVVDIIRNGNQLTLKAAIKLPEGLGPFPAVIGMNMPTGSLPAKIFTDRKIATITYSHNQVTTYYKPSNDDPFYKLYPHLNIENSGQYAAWAWGISRIIDGLELCKEDLPIDLKHLAVTGCSYAGKMALFAGAFDERIALTISQESGGGGVAAWRVSETIGKVEKLGATNYQWFKDDMIQFKDAGTARLPFDHHELCAMIAPRALLVFGNPDYEWLADQSGHVSIIAAREVWKAFGIADRCGYSIKGGHGHCMLPTEQHPELEAFVDKFLLGINSVNTNVTKSTFDKVDHLKWFDWWGK